MKTHEDSALKMEVTGVQRIFSRSIETNKLRYTEYYGDGLGRVVLKEECT